MNSNRRTFTPSEMRSIAGIKESKCMSINRRTAVRQNPSAFHMGFTLIELLIFLGIFAFTSAAFITVLLTVTRVQVRQASVAEVSEQSQFLLQQIQYYIEKSSLVNIPQDTPTSTLKLWTGVNAQDPTYITLQGGVVYLQQTATGMLQALTSNKVTVSNLTFTKRVNLPGHDSVGVSFTLAYNTSNIEQAFSQMLQTSIAQVSAATFDTGVFPSSTPEPLGATGQLWSPINSVLYFNGSNVYFNGANVGIGTASPNAPLDIAGTSLIVETAYTPSKSTSTCSTGMLSWDANYIYVCTAANNWKRATLGSF